MKQKPRGIFDLATLYNFAPTGFIVDFPEGSFVRAADSFELFQTIHG